MAFFGLFGPPNVEKLQANGNVQRLIKALSYEKDWKVRVAAANALGQLGDTRAVEPLVARLQYDGPYVPWLARARRYNAEKAEALMAALVKMKTAAVEQLIVALQHSHSDMQQAAALVLGQLGDIRAVEPLVARLQDNHGDVRWAAAEALKSLGWQAVDDVQWALLDVHFINPIPVYLGRDTV